MLFALLTWQVSSGGPLTHPERRLLRWFTRMALAHPGADTTAHYLCKLGNVQVAVPALLAAIVLTGRFGYEAGIARWWLPPAAGAVAMSVVPLVVVTVKDAVGRPAPGKIHPGPAGYGFFPSGHTATSAVAYGTATLLLLPWIRRAVLRAALAAATVLLLFAVGAALVWCDYHWPLDVAASWCMALSLWSGVAVAQALSEPPPRAVAADPR